jgi:hypothetical protein
MNLTWFVGSTVELDSVNNNIALTRPSVWTSSAYSYLVTLERRVEKSISFLDDRKKLRENKPKIRI